MTSCIISWLLRHTPFSTSWSQSVPSHTTAYSHVPTIKSATTWPVSSNQKGSINVRSYMARLERQEGLRTDPEAWETIPPMEGKCDAERQSEDVVSHDIKRRAEMLSALPPQYATARTG